jgi:NADH-quinone oxidoreductase subunit G
MANLIKVTIDGRELEVPQGTLIWEAARQAGIPIPIYCYHPKMKPLGACRICLVQVEKMPRLQTACTTAVTDGMVVHTQNETVTEARAGIMEFLLINHPLDCPICDRGGECDLQDFAVAYGRGHSRFIEEKRHQAKAVDLGPHVVLDRERCILCQRCVRFCSEVAEEPGLILEDRGGHMQVATFHDQPFDSQFSGNTIEICPVGALTSKDYRFRARPWELQAVPSVCPHCPVGCNLRVDVRMGREVVRFRSRANETIDDGWLCDRGRYGHEFIHSPERLTTPLIRRNGTLEPASWDEALDAVAAGLQAAYKAGGGDAVGAIGSSHTTNEEAFAFQKLIRAAFQTNNIDHRHGFHVVPPVEGISDLENAAFMDLGGADDVILIGADPAQRQPVLDLLIKKARRHGCRVTVINAQPTSLDDIAEGRLAYAPGTLARTLDGLSWTIDRVDRAFDAGLPPRDVTEPTADFTARTGIAQETLEEVGEILAGAGRTVVFYDELALDAPEAAADVVAALRRLAQTLQHPGWPPTAVGPLVRDNNSLGARDMGLLPEYLPGYQHVTDGKLRSGLERRWGTFLCAQAGLNYHQMLGQAPAPHGVKALYIFGSNPLRHDPNVRALLEKLDFLVVQDLFLTETAQLAHVVLPGVSFAEKGGTVTNTERCVQRQRPAIPPLQGTRTDLAVLVALAGRLGVRFDETTYEGVFAEIAATVPLYRGLTLEAVGWQGARRPLVAPVVTSSEPQAAEDAATVGGIVR